ncbi:MAG TPA: hypothetical protein VMM76_21300 [Pirellulaceae bacterium]|nr:hypothetical protein [Pirellulaceae bacterium]
MSLDSSSVAARRAFAAAPRDGTAAMALLIISLGLGCGSRGGAPALNEDVAKSSLSTVLDAWKQGQTQESLQQGSPSIIVVESQWKAGQRLVSYQVLDPSTSDGSNLHVPVVLELEDGAGVRSKHKVQYTVGTSPKITVFLEETEG